MKSKKKILAILGEGGHSSEILRLIELIGDDYSYYYIVIKNDIISKSKIKDAEEIIQVDRVRNKIDNYILPGVKTILLIIKSIKIICKIQPNAILSTGPAVAVPICLVGKLFRKKIVFVETGSRVTTLSTTGKILYRFSDIFFVQWPKLKSMYPKAIYAGRFM
jgi:UDP-N-acetylglucosamine:LPS N-acetylglucosamine transferase